MLDLRPRPPRTLAFLAIGVVLTTPVSAQARPGLPVRVDPSGVLSAVRAVDFRQLCRCATVVLDSTVRVAPRLQVFGVLSQPVLGQLARSDVDRLALRRHRVARSTLRALPRGERDKVFVVVQVVGNPEATPERRIAVIATPPNGIVTTYLVRMVVRKGGWRALETRQVMEP